MEDSVSDDLHASRVLLSEWNVVDTRRFGLVKRLVMRGSRMITHRLVAASGHLADAVQAVDERQRLAVSEVREELATARDEADRVRESVDVLAADVEAARSLAWQREFAQSLADTSERVQALTASVATLQAAVQSLQARLSATEEASAYQGGELRRARSLLGRLARASASVNAIGAQETTDPGPSAEWSADVLLDQQGYLDFEECFRGSRDEIRARQQDAVQYVKDLRPGLGPLLDVACGRGEWLDVLKSAGIEAYGVDANPAMIAAAAAAGLDVRCADALVHLANAEESSLQGISAFHFVEHIPSSVLVKMLDDSLLALRPGGILLLETPNPTNLMVGAATFYLDPTHVRPIHPELLRFLVESRGFVDVEIHYVHPTISAETMIESGPPEGYPDARLNRVVAAVEGFVFGPEDYVLTARRAAVVKPKALVAPTEIGRQDLSSEVDRARPGTMGQTTPA